MGLNETVKKEHSRETKVVNNTKNSINNETTREYKTDTVTDKSPIFEIDLKARLLVVAAQKIGWYMAADNLLYYLDGKALKQNPKKIPRRWLRGFQKVKAAERILRIQYEIDILDKVRFLHTEETNKEIQLTHITNHISPISFNGAGHSREELFYATGNSSIFGWGSFNIVIKGEDVTVTGRLQCTWRDVYNFHNGKCVLIPGLGRIPDSAMRKLLQGKAREYKMISVWWQPLSANFKKNDALYNPSGINWDWGFSF